MAKVSLSELWNQFQAWTARRDNPQGVTASQVGAYTRSEVDNLLSKYLPAGLLPISTFGAQLESEGGISYGSNLGSFNVTLSTAAMDLLLAGTPYRFKANTFNFTVDPNTTGYLYVARDKDSEYQAAYLEIVTTPRADTPESFYVATVTRGDDTTDAVTDRSGGFICLIDIYRISDTPIGSAIPVSSGLPTEIGTYKWG